MTHADRFPATCIEPPPRAPAGDSAITVSMVAFFMAFPLLPHGGVVFVAIGLGLLTLVALAWRMVAAAPVGLFCTLCLVALLVGAPLSQLWFALGLILYAVMIRSVPWLAGSAGWLRRGTLDRRDWLLCAAAAASSGIALVAWYLLLEPDIGHISETFVPDAAPWLLVLGGILFSAINAALEEAAYRGVILHALEAAYGRGAAALIIQAAAFGTLHIHGFPDGWIGVGLAASYGLMLGLIRMRARGMLAPWLAHVLTDLMIVGIVLLLGR